MGYTFEPAPWVPVILLSVSIAIKASIFTKKRTNTIAFGTTTVVTFLGIGMLATVLNQPKNLPNHYQKKVAEIPGFWHLKVREQLKSNTYSHKYVANILAVEGIKAKGRILLTQGIYQNTEPLVVDDEILAFGKVQDIHPPLNPHQFDYKRYTNILGIYHQLRVDSLNAVVLDHRSKTVFGVAANVRSAIISRLKKSGFGPNELSIITALLLGERSGISNEVYTAYKNAGALHILAVSGLHIGILMLLFQYLLKPLEFLPCGKNAKLAALVILLWGFAFLAGLSPSVIRAVTMFSFVAYALYLNRPSNTFNVLTLSLSFMLLIFSPALLFQVGFQMSYAAVFAIVAIYPSLMRIWWPKNILIRKLWQLLAVSLAAQLGVLPISLYYFHQFPGLFFISNLIIVPFLGSILGMGVLVIVLSLFNSAPDWLVWLYNSLIQVMNKLVGWVADQEAFIFKNIPFNGIEFILAYLLIFVFIASLKKPGFKKILIALLLIIGLQLWSLVLRYQAYGAQETILLHQTRYTVLLRRYGQQLNVYSSNPALKNSLIDAFVIGERIEKLETFPLMHSFYSDSDLVFLVDSLGLYPPKDLKVDIVLLTQSPKIHLDRFLDSTRPKLLIADGSNYRSYIKRWKSTCAKRKLPFHYTGEKGAYYFKASED